MGRPRLTPGRRLVKALDAAVEAQGMEWSETDIAFTLPTVEATADRIEMLRSKLDAEANAGALSVRGVQIAGEVRQAEAQLAKLIAGLGLDANDEPAAPKSAQHVAAARTRWDARSHRQKPVA